MYKNEYIYVYIQRFFLMQATTKTFISILPNPIFYRIFSKSKCGFYLGCYYKAAGNAERGNIDWLSIEFLYLWKLLSFHARICTDGWNFWIDTEHEIEIYFSKGICFTLYNLNKLQFRKPHIFIILLHEI